MDDILRKRFRELLERATRGSYYIYTDFYSPAEAELAYEEALRFTDGSPSAKRLVSAWGGQESCERVMLRFGDASEIGYEEPYPLCILRISPKAPKFAEALTHRDFLGALMNLGIERYAIGDIFVTDSCACAFVTEKLSGFITENLDRVKHTAVMCELLNELPAAMMPDIRPHTVNVSALRLVSLIAREFNLSREQTKKLFPAGRISVNGRVCTDPAKNPAEQDIISVHGHGKFVFYGVANETRSGRLCVNVGRYC